MGEVFRKAEAAIYLFAGLLVVLGAVYVLGEALVQGVGLFLGGGAGALVRSFAKPPPPRCPVPAKLIS